MSADTSTRPDWSELILAAEAAEQAVEAGDPDVGEPVEEGRLKPVLGRRRVSHPAPP